MCQLVLYLRWWYHCACASGGQVFVGWHWACIAHLTPLTPRSTPKLPPMHLSHSGKIMKVSSYIYVCVCVWRCCQQFWEWNHNCLLASWIGHIALLSLSLSLSFDTICTWRPCCQIAKCLKIMEQNETYTIYTAFLSPEKCRSRLDFVHRMRDAAVGAGCTCGQRPSSHAAECLPSPFKLF